MGERTAGPASTDRSLCPKSSDVLKTVKHKRTRALPIGVMASSIEYYELKLLLPTVTTVSLAWLKRLKRAGQPPTHVTNQRPRPGFSKWQAFILFDF